MRGQHECPVCHEKNCTGECRCTRAAHHLAEMITGIKSISDNICPKRKEGLDKEDKL